MNTTAIATNQQATMSSREIPHEFVIEKLFQVGIARHGIYLMDHFIQEVEREDSLLPDGEELSALSLRVRCIAIAIAGGQRCHEKIHYLEEYFYSAFGNPAFDFAPTERRAAQKLETPGWLYILKNPSMPGLLKIGMTTIDVAGRVKQISSSTGVAEPFEATHVWKSKDCSKSEARAHAILNEYRVGGKEFFRVDEDYAAKVCGQLISEEQ